MAMTASLSAATRPRVPGAGPAVRAAEADDGGAMPGWSHAVVFLAFVAASYLGRSTATDENGLALLWPAGGVAAAWMFFAPRRHRALILATLAATAVFVNWTTGAEGWVAAGFALANLGQVVTFLWIVRSRCPDLWGVAGTRPLAEIRSLSWVTGAAAIGAVLGVAVGEVVLQLVPSSPGGDLVLVWAGRNFAGLLSVFAVVHLVAYRLTGQARFTEVPRWEWLVMTVGTVAVYVPVFAQDTLPLTFVPAMAILLIGLRSDAVVAAAHALLGGAVSVGFTIAGSGPFANIPDQYEQSLVVQLFLTGVLVTGLYLSAAREERAHAAHDLALERARVQEQAELLEVAVDNVSDGLIVMAADGAILNANPAAWRVLDMLNGPRTTHTGGSPLRRVDGQPIPPDQVPSRRALRGETVVREEVVVTDLDGVNRTFSANATPLSGAGRAAAVATFRDVTDERAQVDELSAFAGVVAHDLRGPLAALQGWAELAHQVTVADPGTAEDLVLAVERIRSSSSRLSDLLEDLLVHATSRDRELVREPVDLGELAREVAGARGIEARVDVRPVPEVVGDAVMLRHLVENLVGNAVKYVADGVVPHVVVAGRSAGRWVELTVTDNGIGVPEPMRRAVFERFSRVAGTGRQGTGLGLSICRTIVERHGGEISVAPRADAQGSVFTVRLPAA